MEQLRRELDQARRGREKDLADVNDLWKKRAATMEGEIDRERRELQTLRRENEELKAQVNELIEKERDAREANMVS